MFPQPYQIQVPQVQPQITPQIQTQQPQQQQLQQQSQQTQQPQVVNVPIQIQVQPVLAQLPPVAETRPLLQNIVATANLGCKLDLKEIASRARNAEYNPRRFAAVIMRIREPKTTALVFSSGKMVVTGAKSEVQSSDAAKKFSEIIRKIGFAVNLHDFKIQNMVGSCDVGFPVNLHDLHISDHSQFCTYEPELFPGLIYRKAEPKVVLLIFVSGKLVVTGAKKKADIDRAFDEMFLVLRDYRKKAQ
eukprot:c12096_g1_i2.p1 GENE.c12096_g1_i2~~c12096_g1_i2.p1  ORF type:complete len:246 (-),score=59.93 c12096_g1_i2:469-1206(-)